MSYLIEVAKKYETCREGIKNGNWPEEITNYLQSQMMLETAQQPVIAVFSHLLQSLHLSDM